LLAPEIFPRGTVQASRFHSMFYHEAPRVAIAGNAAFEYSFEINKP
jgi:hypothetical protein